MMADQPVKIAPTYIWFILYISATDFSLKGPEQGEQSLLPTKLITTPHCKLFYKKDNKFNVPKGGY